jgi:hypothetical protein
MLPWSQDSVSLPHHHHLFSLLISTRTRESLRNQTVLWQQFPEPLAPASYATTFNICQGLSLSRVAYSVLTGAREDQPYYRTVARGRRTPNVVYHELLVHSITQNVALLMKVPGPCGSAAAYLVLLSSALRTAFTPESCRPRGVVFAQAVASPLES